MFCTQIQKYFGALPTALNSLDFIKESRKELSHHAEYAKFKSLQGRDKLRVTHSLNANIKYDEIYYDIRWQPAKNVRQSSGSGNGSSSSSILIVQL